LAISLSIFILAYLLFIFLPKRRPHIAIIGTILLILTRTISFSEALASINWNVMGIFVGMLIMADLFMDSRVPAYLAEHIVNRSKNTCVSILLICALTGFISAFVENVATVLIIAPIAMSLAKRLDIRPINMMIAIAISSNLQGSATLIGDPPSMLLGGFSKMTFMDFFFYQGKPSIFFAVELGALASFIVLYFFFKSNKEKKDIPKKENIKSFVPSVFLIGLIIVLAISSFMDTGFSYLAGVLCMVFGLAILIWDVVFQKNSLIKRIKSLDWETTFFLIGIFVIVGSISQRGWIDIIANGLSQVIGGNLLLGYISIVVISVVISAFVDNVPFLVTMLPVAIKMAQNLNVEPSLFLFGLLIGSTLGGNITPIGASANIVATGILKKDGYDVKFSEFIKIGLPFTIAAVTIASLFVWVVWAR